MKQYVDHCRLHSNKPKVKLPCCFKNCIKMTSSYIGLRQHIIRDHAQAKINQRDVKFRDIELKLNCNILSCKYSVGDKHELVKHLKQHVREGMSVECPMKCCNKKYSVVSSFQCHLLRDHASWQSSDLKQGIVADGSVIADNLNLDDGLISEDFDADNIGIEVEYEMSTDSLREQFTENLALFFSKT